jgi:hypothetical protein
MPFSIKAFGWWLSQSQRHRTLRSFTGAAIICFLFAVEVAVLWQLL